MSQPSRKPTDADIDVYGVTHVGKVRRENQDHFLISTLAKQVRVVTFKDVNVEELAKAEIELPKDAGF